MPAMKSAVQGRNGAGIDASSGGWFATIINDGSVRTEFSDSFKDLIAGIGNIEPILVDVPIGLETDSRRMCDIAAKTLLGCRGNSVFYAPSKLAIQSCNYEQANQAHREAVGYGLSQQAYHLGDAIRQVSNTTAGRLEGQIRESHPEVCFFALNGQPVSWSKTTKHGLLFRLKLLENVYDDAAGIYDDAMNTYLRKKASRDDIIDSMVLAWTASHPKLETLPGDVGPNEPRIYYPAPAETSLTAYDII